MLIRLELENFHSVRNRQALDLRVPRNAPDLPERFLNIPSRTSERVARVAILFGPNASGKTTIVRAVRFLSRFVSDSFQEEPDKRIDVRPFEHKQHRSGETIFRFEFAGQFLSDHPACVFEYELRVQHEPEKRSNHVSFEALRFSPQGRPRRLFERTLNEVRFFPDYKVSKSERTSLKVRSNASLISTLTQYDHAPSARLRSYFKTYLSNMGFNRYDESSGEIDFASSFYAEHPDELEALNEVIGTVDLGIERVDVISPDKGVPVAFFTHAGLDRRLIDTRESRGTRRFFYLFIPLNLVLGLNGVAVIDEIDTDIHSLVLPEVVGWFQSRARGSGSAQLLATSHNPALLNSLEKEEVFFTEKDASGATTVFGLQDVKDVRRADNFLKKYIGGEYGAVPRIG